MKRIFFFITLGVTFFLNTQGQNFIQVNRTNAGETVQVAQDQILEINLPRKSSTGYTWCESSISTDKAVQRSIAKIGDDSFIHDNTSGTLTKGKTMLGQSGTQVIRYAGNSQGTTVLTFELKRPWEKNGEVLDNFTITVVSNGKYTGSYTAPVKEKSMHVTSTLKSVPSSWDWRSQCTPIANQQSCGDCWAFASVGTLECNILIHDSVTRDISEEFLTDCFTANNCSGCNGGNCAHQAWMASYTASNPLGGGAVYETEDAWANANVPNGTVSLGSCSTSGYSPHETIDSYANVSGEDANGIPPDANMKTAIYNFGPIWIAVDASSNAWNNYSGGILTENSQTGQCDHAVVLVGWVDSTAVSGGGYWILRNSWGPSWGVNGYMYISYGSDLVGTDAAYLVYKGGIPHAVPPVTDFEASTTSSCVGTIQFTDMSSNNPSTWLWDFGDGTTSTLENPSHTYTSNGTFTVSLLATNTYGNNTATKTSYVTINLPTAPTTTAASTISGGNVTLHASGADTLKWYDAATGGNLVNTGTSYTISSLNSNETFYVESDVTTSQPTQSSVGMTANTTNGSAYTSTSRWGELFDALVPITIQTVTVYATGTANRTIFLQNSSGTVIDSLVTNIASGTQTVTLNFNVPVGTGYILGCSGSNNLWRDKGGAVYPYTIPGAISITGNTANATGYYYYFYNWQVGYTSTTTCISARVPVTASITAGINENSEPKLEIFPNPSNGEFTISFNNASLGTYKMFIVNSLGQEVFTEPIINSNYKRTFNFKDLSKGVYQIRLIGENNILNNKMIIY